VLAVALRAPGLDVTAVGGQPRAVGVRAPYAAIPAPVRTWVEATLGSPVVHAAEQVGGMSPGCATRLTCADGTRAFVKAVGAELNPETPAMFRREITVLGLIGSDPMWADLLASYDDGGWVALLLEDVKGRHPDLADDAVMDRLLTATDSLGTRLAERVPTPPRADPTDGGLNHMGRVFAKWADSLSHLDVVPEELLPGWVRRSAPGIRADLVALAESDQHHHLVHWDIRNDNLLQRPGGELVFVDWGMAAVGPDWLDPLLTRLERAEHPWFDSSLASSPALRAVGDDAVTTWLAGFGAFLAWRAVTAVDVNLPTLGEFRRTESRRILGAAARRLEMPSG